MDIKSKVEEILAKENYTFTQLAEYLHMTEGGLTHELNNKTLELRNLEAISKALRVPLYSFFRNEGFKFDFTITTDATIFRFLSCNHLIT